jgi:hypothetical protein
MKSSHLSSFNQAMKEFGEAYFGNPNIRDGTQTALTILLGNLTLASKKQKKSRDWIEIEMAIHNIKKHVQELEFLKHVWERTLPIFLHTLSS